MIDLHCHILPELDDGATDLEVSLEMARMAVADGIRVIACTPHNLPGLYHTTGPQIRSAIEQLRKALAQSNIDLELVSGSDAHMASSFVEKISAGEILTLADSRYVLVEPPYHVAPIRLEQFFNGLVAAGYVPIITHPERLKWLRDRYKIIERLNRVGIWIQITAGSLTGKFGSGPRYWAERMLDDGLVHIIASDAHNAHARAPNLSRAWEAAARRLGECEATNMVSTRPRGVIQNEAPANLPPPSYRVPPVFSTQA
jgi:protein-tyrosine phosphatase